MNATALATPPPAPVNLGALPGIASLTGLARVQNVTLNNQRISLGIAPESPEHHALTEVLEPADYICRLARNFPSLRPLVPQSPKDWHILRFMGSFKGASDAEWQAACFIANVWDPGRPENKKAWRFDLMEALSTWDSENKHAFHRWALCPYWP